MDLDEIVKHLLKYGNCYSVNDLNSKELEYIERHSGLKVTKRFAKTCETGFIIEKVQKNVI